MPGVSAYDPLDALQQIDDPNVQYFLQRRKYLEDAGVKYVGQLFFIDPVETSGVDPARYQRSLVALRKYLTNTPGSGVDAYTLMKRSGELVRYLHTGSFALDYILGGGIRTGIVTEFAGPYRSGKTQVSLTTSITVQLPNPKPECDRVIVVEAKECKIMNKKTGETTEDLSVFDPVGRGLGKKTIYIDTEMSFEPARLIPIAKRFGLDPEQALRNVIVYRVTSVAEQFEAAYQAGMRIPEDNVGLVVVDSLMNLFRAEYVGREKLAERQQMVNKFVHMLVRMAEVYNIAVIITNQVMDMPEARYGDYGTDGFGLKVVGGHVVAHNVGVRVMLNTSGYTGTKGKRPDNPIYRKAKIIDSSFLPQREAKFGIVDHGVVDVDYNALCSFARADFSFYGKVRDGFDRLIIPGERLQKRLQKKEEEKNGKKTKAKKSA